MRLEAKALDTVFKIGVNLRLRAIGLRPVGLRREGKGIEVRGHVAGAAGIGIVPPGAADALRLLQDDEILIARALQPDPGTDAARSGADDSDPHRSSSPKRFLQAYRANGAWARLGILKHTPLTTRVLILLSSL